MFCPVAGTSHGAETNPPPAAPSQIDATNLLQLVHTCQRLQEQLQATQVAVEQNRQETKAAAAQNAEALSRGLQGLQEALSAQRAQDFAAWQKSNQTMLITAGAFGAVGLLAMLIMIYFQWRTSDRLAGIPTALFMSRGFASPADVAALAPGDGRLPLNDAAEQSKRHLLGALDLLDHRIHEFKQAIAAGGDGDPASAQATGPPAAGASRQSQPADPARVTELLSQAQSMINSGNPDAAVTCLDEVLALDPDHPEAWVRKGVALERLHKLNEAIECYDRAIARDASMTTAYLHKGGLCNRLERFKEALECYEKALYTQVQRGS
jgi:tetratricopeptide (TPR) repeat protein